MSSTPSRPLVNGHHRAPNGLNLSARRGASMTRDHTIGSSLGASAVPSAIAEEEEREENPIHLLLKQRLEESQASLAAIFSADGQILRTSTRSPTPRNGTFGGDADSTAKPSAPPQKAARTIDDDYGDDDEEDEEEEGDGDAIDDKDSPLKAKGQFKSLNGFSASPAIQSPFSAPKPQPVRTNTTASSNDAKSTEDVRKQLEEEKRAATDAARRSFQTMFFTWENDRDAMLEQQKLDELDREVENEISRGSDGVQNAQQNGNGGPPRNNGQGSLGSADLGASSLTLKHLIARIDAKRNLVKASDNQLRTLISEVRKGRSKWASEDKVGQEELYEASEKVLMELKAMTEYVKPFLSKVSKREAPDYYNVIKHPMDIGTMIKNLKQLQYKSKKAFVDDLNLIWSNCLKYNSTPDHPFRKKALYMRKETDKLTPLIPEIVVRDRAEVEAEERRLHALEADDSDEDDAPIMASRGRKAPQKSSKGAPSSARKSAATAEDAPSSTAASDVKPALHTMASNLRNEFLRADSEAHDASSAGFSTPPPGTATPMVNGIHGHTGTGTQIDYTDAEEGAYTSLSAQDDADEDDTEFKTWKQVTKKDRATAAAERNKLFRGDQLNPEEPALLRSKAMMRRWIRQQKLDPSSRYAADNDTQAGIDDAEAAAAGETLAEGIEEDEDSTLPDYYNPVSAIPDIDEKWKWAVDSEGQVVSQTEQWMRVLSKDKFKSTQSALTKRVDANMRQMQDTRKICSKIGIVKQMQLQGQTYQNQFQKYDPEPFVEHDIGPAVVSEDGPLMHAPWLNRAAFQRSVAKIFYHAGFEDFQPSALDTATDLAGEYLSKLFESLKVFKEQPQQALSTLQFSYEEQVLHSLYEVGLDLDGLETYIKEDVERLSTKLGVMHERMKAHYTELLRPALSDHAGQDGAGVFHDGSDQFVGGDFAEDMGEDYFGFKELGLAEEFGLEALSVPFHLLQNRMHSAYQVQHQGPVANNGVVFSTPEPYSAITTETLSSQIGIVQEFFRNRLRNNHDNPLIEDEDLPQKQRFPKPRLPPTGKISSPRKRPIREQQQAAKKKRKLEESEEKARLLNPVGPFSLSATARKENATDPAKEADTAMMSPESLTAE